MIEKGFVKNMYIKSQNEQTWKKRKNEENLMGSGGSVFLKK